MYRRPPMTRNKVATAAKIPMIHNLRPSMTSGMVFTAGTSGSGAAASRSPARETMVCACMGDLHKDSWDRLGGNLARMLAGGGAPPYVDAKVGGQYAVPGSPASRPRS